jgi:hypothetical protein
MGHGDQEGSDAEKGGVFRHNVGFIFPKTIIMQTGEKSMVVIGNLNLDGFENGSCLITLLWQWAPYFNPVKRGDTFQVSGPFVSQEIPPPSPSCTFPIFGFHLRPALSPS